MTSEIMTVIKKEPEDCSMEELLSIIADADEDEAKEQYDAELWLQSLEEYDHDLDD